MASVRSFFSGLWRALMWTGSVLAFIALFATSYAGHIEPSRFHGLAGVAPLAMPIALAALIFMLVLCLFTCRRAAILCGIGLLSCAVPLWNYCPLNVGNPKPDGRPKLTLLSYNVLAFNAYRPYEDRINPSAQYILDVDADIVCLQECPNLGPYNKFGIPREFRDSLQARYPYIFVGGRSGNAFLCKYKTEAIPLTYTEEEMPDGSASAYRVEMPDGSLITVFNIHLHSFDLKDKERDLYRDILKDRKVDRSNLLRARHEILSKLSKAAVGRGVEARTISGWVHNLASPNTIICGDFNDVSDCYAINTFEDLGFREVYPRVGFGPIITYNAGGFYFGIDHILTRGTLRPLWLKKGTVNTSDHYPILTKLEYGD